MPVIPEPSLRRHPRSRARFSPGARATADALRGFAILGISGDYVGFPDIFDFAGERAQLGKPQPIILQFS